MNLINAARTRLTKLPGVNKAIDNICARANEVFGQQHNNETGEHTDITADSITLNGSGSVPKGTRMEVLTDDNTYTITIDDKAVWTLQRNVGGSTIGFVPHTANGVGNYTGNQFAIGRNSSGSGAPGALELFDKSGSGTFFWVDTTGVLRSGTALPQEDGAPADTSGTPVGGGLGALLAATDGFDTTAAAANVATVAISGLTIRDRLLVLWQMEADTANTTGPIMLYNATDSVVLSNLVGAGAGVNVGQQRFGAMWLSPSRIDEHLVQAMGTHVLESGAMANFASARATMTQLWSGSWTLALRHSGVVAGGSCHFSWNVLKVAGQ